MVQAISLAALEALRSAESTQQQIEILRKIKNSLVGHDQRKEHAVRDGILDTLVNIVSHAGSGERNGTAIGHTQAWTQQDQARLDATTILGSLATGGTAYVAPLVVAGTVEALTQTLRTGCAPKLVTSTLQTLRNLASAWKLSRETSDTTDVPSLNIFNNDSSEIFLSILRQSYGTEQTPQQLPLVCDIIALSAQEDSVRSFLTHYGFLDTFAGLLVSHSIANKHIDYRSDTSHLLPQPPASAVPNIIAAVSSLVSGSTYRAHRFVFSEQVKDMFLNFSPGEGDLRYMMGPKYGMPNAEGSLLPPLHIPSNKSVSFGGSSSSFPSGRAYRQNGVAESSLPQGDIDHANAVCSWLLYFVRFFQGPQRIQALQLLAMVNEAVEIDTGSFPRHELSQKSRDRERQMTVLAVPLAVRLVQDGFEYRDTESPRKPEEMAAVRESGCEALANLISCNRNLQAAAVEAGAIKYVCPILRKSFDHVPLAKPMWPANRAASDESEKPASCHLGNKGLPLEIMHSMRCRQGALLAVAAIGHKEDVHRKAIVEAGVIQCIIDSLRPFPQDLQASIMSNKGQLSAKDGNTTAVILAACNAAKSMSRSISLLRTSLIDAGVAKPLFELLKHQNLDVQIAATNVCTNLLVDFSPMREDLMTYGVTRTLCEHAKRSSPALRLSSLWALKHLLLSAPKDFKIDTLEELGTGWLVAAIAGQPRDETLFANGGGVSVGLSSSNAAGEQIDLLNPSSMDVDEPIRSSHDDSYDDDDDEDGEIMYDEPSNTHYQASQIRSTLPPTSGFNTKKHLYTVRELEENPQLQARRDDLAIQEQALDFLRNLFHGEDCSDMVNYVFSKIGHQKIYDLITAKLAPLPVSQRQPSTGTPGANGASRQIYNPTQIILSATHVVIHLANSAPQHKQLLIAQRPLLQAWLPHFSHADPQVRVNCVWAVNSLTWIEDERDRADARLRTQELRAVGIEAAVRALANDPALDVKERVKVALHQMDSL